MDRDGPCELERYLCAARYCASTLLNCPLFGVHDAREPPGGTGERVHLEGDARHEGRHVLWVHRDALETLVHCGRLEAGDYAARAVD